MGQEFALVMAAALILALPIVSAPAGAAPAQGKPGGTHVQTAPEGKASVAEIVVGPFDLHRKYRSMEGPYVVHKLRVGDLIASKRLEIPESMVTFVEGNPDRAPAMGGPPMSVPTESSTKGKPMGLVDTTGRKRELLWFKGMKIQVLDENDKPLPTAEFICHLNLDVDRDFRIKAFPQAEPSGNARLMTLTQGQTEFYFPRGLAVPVASDEVWTFTFQAANRTSSRHRRVKHLCTVSFIKDSDLSQPVKALHWYNPYIVVAVDKNTPEAREAERRGHFDCLGISDGQTAPNTVPGADFDDSFGRKLSGHWVVPPGTTTWSTPITEERDPGFADRDRRIHAVWSHVHPLCTTSSLVMCNGQSRKKVFTAGVKTKTAGGLEIERIDNIISEEGIVMPAGHHYELEATYVNPTGEDQDSMVALGIFCADEKFVKPVWPDVEVSATAVPQLVLGESQEGFYCGIKGLTDAASQASTAAKPDTESFCPNYALFQPDKDGPLITEPKTIELDTSAGRIRLVLDPALAPMHATQLYRLLKAGAFNGTPIYRYEPNFVLQVDMAERKASGKPALNQNLLAMLRRLPLEVPAQKAEALQHRKWALSMARYSDTDSAVSSFSILLGDAPHLDNQYTVFGYVVPDAVTTKTIEKITGNWSAGRPWIEGARDVGASVASSQAQGQQVSQGH